MLFHVERKPFLAALAAFKTVVPPKTSIPVLSNVLLRVAQNGGGSVLVDGTDLDTFATVALNASVESVGAVCVPRAPLHAALKACTSEIVTIKRIDLAVVITGGCETRIPTMAADEYPKVPNAVTGQTFALSRDTLRNIDRTVRPAVSTDETRYLLNGIYFDSGLAVATDGHRMHCCKTDLAADAPRVIIPSRGWDAFAAFLPSGGWLSFDKDRPHATLASTFKGVPSITITVRLIEGRFPDWRQVAPQRSPDESRATFDAKPARQAVKVHAALAGGKRMNGTTRFHMNGALALNTCVFEKGEAAHSLTVERKGGDVTWGANAGYVLEALECFDGPVTLYALAEKDAPQACSLNPFELTDDNGTRCVIMPVRI